MYCILFLCTANLYRSPLAAALFCRKLQADQSSERWIVDFAGTWTTPGQHVPPDLLKIAGALEIDLRGHITRQLDRRLLMQSDLILVMEKGHQESLRLEFPSVATKVHLLSEVADGLEYDVADPVNSDLSLEEVLAELSRLIDQAYPNVCKLARAARTI